MAKGGEIFQIASPAASAVVGRSLLRCTVLDLEASPQVVRHTSPVFL